MNIELSDSTLTAVLPPLEVPLTTTPLESATKVTTLDFNQYVDFVANKRQWSHTWAYLTEEQYNLISGFYFRQFTLFDVPSISIPFYGIENVPVVMSIGQKDVIDDCGTVGSFTITLRETQRIG